jgi:hypothetical protein
MLDILKNFGKPVTRKPPAGWCEWVVGLLEIDRQLISLEMWHVNFACACALCIVYLFFSIPGLF